MFDIVEAHPGSAEQYDNGRRFAKAITRQKEAVRAPKEAGALVCRKEERGAPEQMPHYSTLAKKKRWDEESTLNLH